MPITPCSRHLCQDFNVTPVPSHARTSTPFNHSSLLFRCLYFIRQILSSEDLVCFLFVRGGLGFCVFRRWVKGPSSLKGTFARVSGFGTKSRQGFKVPVWAWFWFWFCFGLGFWDGLLLARFPALLQEVAKRKLDSCLSEREGRPSVLGPLPQGPEGDACSLAVQEGRTGFCHYILYIFVISYSIISAGAGQGGLPGWLVGLKGGVLEGYPFGF